MSAMHVLHVLAAIVVMSESLNKLERCHPLAPGLSRRERAVDWLKAVAWSLFAFGAGGPLIDIALPMPEKLLDLAQVCTMTGFAVLIIRTRIKEG